MVKRVLMLHGLAQSGEYFASKTKGFRTELEKEGYELSYATAPKEFLPADIPDSYSEVLEGSLGVVLAWIENDLVNNSYFLPKETIDYLHDYVLDNGPFHGIVGFSQGAGVAGYLMTDFNGLLGLSVEEQPPLKFFIAFSGFRFRPEIYQEQYDKHPITVPSLHVQGELDTITEFDKVEGLYNSCSQGTRTLIRHPGGHYVPNSKGFSKKVINWLHQVDN
ncbi:hypothetical protein Kpol_1064p47 [Vanderwaltozyma polyspora DSM 70294]|uniref:Serine hydrolase domain-containing protein n=1 Tax=Vanderwaltozyma polyspora (strain ATCC 22028 / DSM 70294 / BCRC 21397 / CBS 2163 / NBRC 10782 / NRRL Y-8283 / UCD 57-17) TaxID=436907 RepID=A7TMH1_VANPO|nr:uncharacterized protein Kpol_1064p47 [Vanderwaltozyma polyspora DSM 70294]EDO16565.1 hypothetical protein Kpol_1064p47 [Vanderwaltozyma polyspora DSM 70294]